MRDLLEDNEFFDLGSFDQCYDDLDTIFFGDTEQIDNKRMEEILENQQVYLYKKVDWKNSRFPSKWLDALRERNKCPLCTHIFKHGYNEYNEGVLHRFRNRPLRATHEGCPICNPLCVYCSNERKKGIDDSKQTCDQVEIECPSCYRSKDIWRITPTEEILEYAPLGKPIPHLYLGTLDIPCPRCLGPTVKNGKNWKRKCKDKQCIEMGKKSTYTFRFKKFYEREILKERVYKLFVQRVGYSVMEELEGINRRLASKWVSQWLYSLPTSTQLP